MEKQTEKQLTEIAEQAVDRAAKTLSKQPRFHDDGAEGMYTALANWLKRARELEEPNYSSDSRKRDTWLQQFWHIEPHWAGVVQQTVMIDSNRGWMMLGGRNQVNTYTDMMHNAEQGQGWRLFAKKASTAFRTADMCSVVEIGRQGKNGPMRAIYNVDPARCKLSGNNKTPLWYYPASGGTQKWRQKDFFRCVAMPSNNEKYNNLGYCATSIALELVKLLYAILVHDQEEVGARMPEGLLLLQGVEQTQWDDMMEARESQLDAKGRRFFGSVYVLATSGIDQLNARLVALSNLPRDFDRETFTNLTMYAYALITGYAPGEFWPITGAVLGRGKEEETQQMRATTKGGMDFALSFQEQLQQELPASLHFEFEQRDEAGDLVNAQVSAAWVDIATQLYTPTSQFTEPLLTKDQALSFLAVRGIIPVEWTEQEEKDMATDTENVQTRALDLPAVRRACEVYQDEPIVLYKWNGVQGRETVLWSSGAEALRPRLWSRPVIRQAEDDSEVLVKDGPVTITEADVDRAIADGERRLGEQFAEKLVAKLIPEELLEEEEVQ